MKARAVVIGAGGFGREVRDWIMHSGSAEFIGFIDDGTPGPQRLHRLGAKHLGGCEDLGQIDAVYYLGVGDSSTRQQVDARARRLGAVPGPPLIHPTAVVGADTTFGEGTVVCPGAIVTTNVRVGRHCNVHVGATVGHDTMLGDFVTISPGATVSGACLLETGCTIGTNAAIRQGIRIGAGAVVGAGAAAVRDVPGGEVWVGVPARLLHGGADPR